MKKMLIIFSFSALAFAGVAMVAVEYASVEGLAQREQKKTTASDIFAQNERLMREIFRYGDKKSLEALPQSVNNLNRSLAEYQKDGIDLSTINAIAKQYTKESIEASRMAYPFLDSLKQSSSYEKQSEKKFMASIAQIGLNELTDSIDKMQNARLKFIKEPTDAHAEEYALFVETSRQLCVELYLDEKSESVLLGYIDNHKKYFQTIASMYKNIGTSKIENLKNYTASLKAELQLLPNI